MTFNINEDPQNYHSVANGTRNWLTDFNGKPICLGLFYA